MFDHAQVLGIGVGSFSAARGHAPPADTSPRVSSPGRDCIDELGEAIAETAAHVDAATHRLLTQIREFDEAAGWYQQGATSCAHWLSWRVGLSPGVARERVRVANALGVLPAIDAALSRGEVSYCKVRAMTRVATPEIEETLLDMARHATGAELEKICRLYRGVQADQHVDARGRDDRRYVQARGTDDGMVRITAVVTAEESGRIMKAIDSAAERVCPKSDGRETRLCRADGLAHLAEEHLRGDVPDRAPVEVIVTTSRVALSKPAELGSAETPPEPSGSPMRDVPLLEDEPVSAETARRLACDAGIVEVDTGARGTPLDVGRKTRAIHPALRRALQLRDRGCAFPGCSRRRFVDAHHIIHWADGGETNLDNLVLLCGSHHTLVHELGYTIEASPKGFAFRDPQGRSVPLTGPQRSICIETLLAAHKHRGLHIDPETNMPRWSGTPPDYSACIDALLSRQLQA
jgi:hypothetical protein